MKCAKTWEYAEKVDKHTSQKDYAKGFGGKYGVELDRKDKNAVGWDEKMVLSKHGSQIGKEDIESFFLFSIFFVSSFCTFLFSFSFVGVYRMTHNYLWMIHAKYGLQKTFFLLVLY